MDFSSSILQNTFYLDPNAIAEVTQNTTHSVPDGIIKYFDQNLCHSGGYIYIEASEPQRRGDRALLMGMRMCGTMCLQFYYSMNGRRMGTLNVYKREGVKNDDLIWSMSGNQGNEWQEALVDMGGACYQVRMSSR